MFHGFMVSWFHGFMVSWFHGFMLTSFAQYTACENEVEGKRERDRYCIREYADVDKEVQIQRQTTSTTKITHL
jgi:hypothetical protein